MAVNQSVKTPLLSADEAPKAPSYFIDSPKFGALNFETAEGTAESKFGVPIASRYNVNGSEYYFVPENYVLKGAVKDKTQVYSEDFLNKDNLKRLYQEAENIDLGKDIKNPVSDLGSKGFLMKPETYNSLFSNTRSYSVGKKVGKSTVNEIQGLSEIDGNLVYVVKSKRGGGKSTAWIQPEGPAFDGNKKAGTGSLQVRSTKQEGGFLGEVARAVGSVPLLPEIAGAVITSYAGPQAGAYTYGALKGVQGGVAGKDPLEVGLQVGATIVAQPLVKSVLPADLAAIPGVVPGVSATGLSLLSGASPEEAIKAGVSAGVGSAVGSQVAGATKDVVSPDVSTAIGNIAGGTTSGLLGGKSGAEAFISSTIGTTAGAVGSAAGEFVNKNLFSNTPQTGAGTMDDFSNGGIQLFDDGSSIFFDNKGNIVGGLDFNGSIFNVEGFDLEVFDDGTFLAIDANGGLSFSTTDAPLFTGNAVVGSIGQGIADTASTASIKKAVSAAASKATSAASKSILNKLAGAASSVVNDVLGTNLSGDSVADLVSALVNRGIDAATAEKIANQLRSTGETIAGEARAAGEAAAVPFTPYTVTSGLGSTTVGPTGATTSLAPEYGDIRTSALGKAADALSAVDPARASETLFGQLEGLAAPTRQRQQEQLLSSLGAKGLLGIGRNLPTVGGGVAGVNPYVESLLSAQGTERAQNALASTQFGTTEAQRVADLSKSLLGIGTGLDTLGLDQLKTTSELGKVPLAVEQRNQNLLLESVLEGLKYRVPLETAATNIQAGQTALTGDTIRDLVNEIFKT